MSKTKRKNTIFRIRNREEGVALIAAILTLLLISAITAGILILTNTETVTSANFKDEQRAFFSAKAGIEEVRDRLRTAATGTLAGTSSVLPTTLTGTSSTGVTYVLNPLGSETVAPWTAPTTSSPNPYADDEICKETNTVSCSSGYPSSGGWYRSTSPTANSTYAASPVLDWKWVRIQLKQSNAFGTNYAVNGDNTKAYFTCLKDGSPYEVAFATFCAAPTYLPVYVLTSLAVTPSGSRRMVQVEVGQDTIQFTAPAALTVDGLSPSFSGGTSANFGVNGIDVGGCGATTLSASVPAVGVINGSPASGGNPATGDVLTVSSNADIPSKTANNYTGLGYTGAKGTSGPDVENVTPTLAAAGTMQTVSELQDLVSTLKGDITQPVINGPASSLPNAGTLASPQIIYVNGDLTLSGSDPNPSKKGDGYGILIVTGKLTVKGTVAWDGLVLVVGQGNLQMDGTNAFAGSVLVAKTLDSSGNPLTTGLGVPTFGVNGGGSAKGGIDYSAGCLTNATQLTTYHVISMRELMN
jgi:Tfp pilus assembly protein PilX